MNISNLRQTTAVCAAVFIFCSATTAALAGVLTGDQFVETHAGKCISYAGESKGIQCYHADGTMEYDDESYGKDTGTWSVEGDTICQEWSAEPGVSCVSFNDDGNGTYSEGAYTWTIND